MKNHWDFRSGDKQISTQQSYGLPKYMLVEKLYKVFGGNTVDIRLVFSG